MCYKLKAKHKQYTWQGGDRSRVVVNGSGELQGRKRKAQEEGDEEKKEAQQVTRKLRYILSLKSLALALLGIRKITWGKVDK